MGKKKKHVILPSIIIILITISIGFLIKTNLTGYAIYEESSSTKNWDFENQSEYNYNSSLIEITNGEAKLISIINYTSWNTSKEKIYDISQILYDSKDETDKITEFDNNTLNVNKNKLFNIFFNENLNNKDIVSIYIEKGSACTIYLCNNDSSCNSPGYGSLSFNGDKGFYNITLNGLNIPTNGLSIKTDKNYELDYIKASNIIYEENNSTEIIYPESAEIETNDFETTNLKVYDIFQTEEILNNQTIEYYYSTDSGANWNILSNSENLSNINISNKKIKIKAKLNSNKINTPILNNISLNYLTQEPVTIQEETNNEPSSNGGGGSNGGSSNTETISSSVNKINKNTSAIKKISIENDLYKDKIEHVEIILSNDSLIENNYIEGKITNKGKFLIDKLDLNLNSELQKFAIISNSSFENIKSGESLNFSLIKKNNKQNKKFFTGLITKQENIKEKISGNLVVQIEDLQKNMSIEVEVLTSKQILDKRKIIIPGATGLITLIATTLILVLIKRIKSPKNKIKSKYIKGR